MMKLIDNILGNNLRFLIISIILICMILPSGSSEASIRRSFGKLSSVERNFARERALEIIDRLQPSEKVGQLMLVTFKGKEAGSESQIFNLITEYHIGGIVLLSSNDNFIGPDDTPRSAWNLIRELQVDEWKGSQSDVTDSLGNKIFTPEYIPLFIGINQEGDGAPFSQIINGLTPLPNQMAIGATWKPELAQSIGNILGLELSRLGVNMFFGPSLDILENPNPSASGDLGIRTFGGDPFWVGEMAKAYISGIHQGSNSKIAVVAKYFPGRGGSDRLPEEEVATIRKSLDQLNQIELAPFFAVTGNAPNLEATTDALIVSHIRYKGFQGNIRTSTRPISFDPQTLNQLMSLQSLSNWRLKRGVLVSDDLGNQAVRRFYDPTMEVFNAKLVARDALLAGNDLLYLGNFIASGDTDSFSTITQTLSFFEQKYKEDKAFAQRVDEALLRILTLKYNLYPEFNLDRVVSPIGTIGEIGKGAQVIFEVAQKSATLIDPLPSELDVSLPNPPQINDRIVFIVDNYMVRQCLKCPDQPLMAVNMLQEAVQRLYGQSPGGLIRRQNLISFPSSKLKGMLDKERTATNLEYYLRQADWIVLTMLDVKADRPDSQAILRLLKERPDLLKNKKIIVFSFNAPYYLDATDISKITAYYGLYSKGPQFIEVAARLLFNELRPIVGVSPVSIQGIGYDLISIISPDPKQTISITLDPSEIIGREAGGNKFGVGDLVSVRTGIIMDYNGHYVPDNTPVHFILSSTGEKASVLEEIVAPTTSGVAKATFAVKSSGTLEISARSEMATQSDAVRIEVPGENIPTQTQPPPTVTISPSITPTMVFPTPTPIPIPQNKQPDKNIVDWLLAVAICTMVSWFVYRLELRKWKIRWSFRSGLMTFLFGTLFYTYLMLELPGGDWLLHHYNHLATLIMTLSGNLIGWLLSKGWQMITERA
ncbi:MAG: glycoside hydrolase family 3 N-terminal domain-containing protein [Chloroflexota bacterium]